MHANVISETEQHIAVRRGGDTNAVSNRPEHNTHTKHIGHKPATQRSQQHKTNMERHRSLKPNLLQAETRKTTKNNPSLIVVPRKNSKERSDLLPSANMGKRFSNIHEPTRRFNVASRKNTKEHYHNPSLRRVISNSTNDHMIQGPSKEHPHTKAKFCAIVIPSRNGKKFPKYYLQPTLEIAFQHSEIKELVEQAGPKKRFL